MSNNEVSKTWQNHQGNILDTVEDYEVIECNTCGFKHIVPIPSVEELEIIYREEYYSKDKPLYIERSIEDQEWWDLVFSERFDTFEEVLKEDCRRILDIGSGPGIFLQFGKNRGWDVLGIEPSAQAAEHSRSLGIEIVEGFLTPEIAEEIGKYDVVHLNEVLEHVPDPKAILQIVGDLLSPSGIICIMVPNDYNPFQDALRSVCGYNPWWVVPPHHINYFNFDSLSALLTNNGFSIIVKDASFPIDMFLLMGDNYTKDDSLGRKIHKKRIQFEFNMKKAGLGDLKRKLYQLFAEQGLGRDVIIIAQKMKQN